MKIFEPGLGFIGLNTKFRYYLPLTHIGKYILKGFRFRDMVFRFRLIDKIIFEFSQSDYTNSSNKGSNFEKVCNHKGRY